MEDFSPDGEFEYFIVAAGLRGRADERDVHIPRVAGRGQPPATVSGWGAHLYYKHLLLNLLKLS